MDEKPPAQVESDGAGAASPYVDPSTGFLRNEVGAVTQEEIDRVVADLLPGRLEELEAGPIPCTGDRAHLQAIHRVLFYGIFSWAGQFRTIDIDKQGTNFTPAGQIEDAIAQLCADLAAENLLVGLPRTVFVERLANFYARLNQIHPFREGNGRTQRLFWMDVALHAGWRVKLLKVPKEINNEASRIASQDGDLQPLVEMLDRVTSPARSVARGRAQFRAALRRRQRSRRLSGWLREHANPTRLT